MQTGRRSRLVEVESCRGRIGIMAERGGFELPEPVKAHSLSRRAQSTTLPPLRFVFNCLSGCGKQPECQTSVSSDSDNFQHSLRIAHCRLNRRLPASLATESGLDRRPLASSLTSFKAARRDQKRKSIASKQFCALTPVYFASFAVESLRLFSSRYRQEPPSGF